jgi:AraC family transcriptional regulator, glycine betaine-responsive activator
MARVADMGDRTFLRHFKSEMGFTPSAHLLSIRLDMACRLLVETSLPIDKIARRCGMGGGIRLARIFKRRIGLSAGDYRARAVSELAVWKVPPST